VLTGAAVRRVLVVDDDAELCHLLSQYLTPEGYEVETVHSGVEGIDRALSGEHAIVILDVMLPDLQGFDVLRRVRERSRAPVLMLTARGDEQDRILGLELGADDYLPKPFNPRELSARIEAILRRTRPDPAAGERPPLEDLRIDDVTLDKGRGSFTAAAHLSI
jgi:two-component system response regulator CpxR